MEKGIPECSNNDVVELQQSHNSDANMSSEFVMEKGIPECNNNDVVELQQSDNSNANMSAEISIENKISDSLNDNVFLTGTIIPRVISRDEYFARDAGREPLSKTLKRIENLKRKSMDPCFKEAELRADRRMLVRYEQVRWKYFWDIVSFEAAIVGAARQAVAIEGDV